LDRGRDLAFATLLLVLPLAVAGGILVARLITRPLGTLADAVGELTAGNPWAPLESSRITEVERLSAAFREMRDRLAQRTAESERLAAELRARAEALAESDRRKDEFLAMLAHELRNPLGAVSTAAYVLGRMESLAPPVARSVAIIQRQSQHLARLVDDLLDVSRITRGKVELRSRKDLDWTEKFPELAEALSQSYAGATMDDVDLDMLARQLGDEAAVDAQTLAELERALLNQGFLDRGADGQWRLSPKAMRQLGQAALRDVAEQLSGRHGERETQRAGAAGELTGATRPWQFGATEPFNVTRTLTNAVLRQAGTGQHRGGPIRMTVDDVEVSETETRTQAAVALLVDTSFSMVMENRWLPMKRTALALNHLVSTRFRSDALQIITFGRYARTMSAAELTGLEGVYEQGTNLHHALALAGRHLRRHPSAQPVVLVVTDGEPTAHLEGGFGRSDEPPQVFFDYPPHPRTIAHTVRGFDDMASLGAQVTIFRLGNDPGLARFIDQVARRVQGRVVVPDLDGLGAAVVGDYLRSRRR